MPIDDPSVTCPPPLSSRVSLIDISTIREHFRIKTWFEKVGAYLAMQEGLAETGQSIAESR